jgi:hypothetical protein
MFAALRRGFGFRIAFAMAAFAAFALIAPLCVPKTSSAFDWLKESPNVSA